MRLLTSSLLALLVSAALPATAQVAGTTTLGVRVEQLQVVAAGWSVRKQVLGKQVVNEAGEKVGRIDDLIVAPDGGVSYAIVGAGGFVGVARHDVAIPVGQVVAKDDGTFVLAGATKAAIKALPAFEYAKPAAPAQ